MDKIDTHSLSINCHFHLENEVCKTNNVKKRKNKEELKKYT